MITNVGGVMCEDYNSGKPITSGATNMQIGVQQTVTVVENALTTLTSANSGAIVFVPQSTHAVSASVNTIKLPAPSAGFRCRIVFQAVGDNTAGHNWAISSTGANVKGNSIGVGAALVGTNQASAITNLLRTGTAANALPGDWVDIACDGTNYFYWAYSSGAGSPWSTS